MLNRVGIFCLYDKNEKLTKSVKNMLCALKEQVNQLVVVINGKVEPIEVIEKISDLVITKKNEGYDMGAYKEAFQHPIVKEYLEEAGELVLCNSSFLLPAISFEELFDVMTKRNVDFWGITSVKHSWVEHIQSYFLVYNKKILAEGKLYEFFDKYVDEHTTDYLEVCGVFENALFHYLMKNGYTYDAFVNPIRYSNYAAAYESVAYDGVPSVKKKIFTDAFFSETAIKNIFKVLYEKDNSSIEELLIEAELNQLDIKEKDIKKHKLVELKNEPLSCEVFVLNQLTAFIEQSKKLYVYGFTDRVKSFFWSNIYANEDVKFKGFVVSDGQNISESSYGGYKVYHFSETEKDASFLVIMGRKNTEIVKKYFPESAQVMCLQEVWDNARQDYERKRNDE